MARQNPPFVSVTRGARIRSANLSTLAQIPVSFNQYSVLPEVLDDAWPPCDFTMPLTSTLPMRGREQHKKKGKMQSAVTMEEPKALTLRSKEKISWSGVALQNACDRVLFKYTPIGRLKQKGLLRATSWIDSPLAASLREHRETLKKKNMQIQTKLIERYSDEACVRIATGLEKVNAKLDFMYSRQLKLQAVMIRSWLDVMTRRKAANELYITRRMMDMRTVAGEWRRVASSSKAQGKIRAKLKKDEVTPIDDDSNSIEDEHQNGLETSDLALYVSKSRIKVTRSTKVNYRRRRYHKYMATCHPLLQGWRHPDLQNLDFMRAPDVNSTYMSLGALVSRWIQFDADSQSYISMPVLEAIQLGQCYKIQVRDAPAEILALIDSGASIFLSRWKAHFPFLMATTMHVQGLGAVSLDRCGPVVLSFRNLARKEYVVFHLPLGYLHEELPFTIVPTGRMEALGSEFILNQWQPIWKSPTGEVVPLIRDYHTGLTWVVERLYAKPSVECKRHLIEKFRGSPDMSKTVIDYHDQYVGNPESMPDEPDTKENFDRRLKLGTSICSTAYHADAEGLNGRSRASCRPPVTSSARDPKDKDDSAYKEPDNLMETSVVQQVTTRSQAKSSSAADGDNSRGDESQHDADHGFVDASNNPPRQAVDIDALKQELGIQIDQSMPMPAIQHTEAQNTAPEVKQQASESEEHIFKKAKLTRAANLRRLQVKIPVKTFAQGMDGEQVQKLRQYLHALFGHLSESTVAEALHFVNGAELAKAINILRILEDSPMTPTVCDACFRGKCKLHPAPKGRTLRPTVKDKVAKMYVDISGKISVPSVYHNFLYFVLAVTDKGYFLLEGISFKSQALFALARMCDQLGQSPSVIAVDGAGELNSHNAKRFFAWKEIGHDTTEAGEHWRLGKAERGMGVVKDMTRPSMLHANAPLEFWFLCLSHMVLIANLIRRTRVQETKELLDQTVWESHFGEKPNITRYLIAPWGCLVYMVLTGEQRRARKLDKSFGVRAIGGIFVGTWVNPRTSVYHFLVHDGSNLLATTSNLTVVGDCFPFRYQRARDIDLKTLPDEDDDDDNEFNASANLLLPTGPEGRECNGDGVSCEGFESLWNVACQEQQLDRQSQLAFAAKVDAEASKRHALRTTKILATKTRRHRCIDNNITMGTARAEETYINEVVDTPMSGDFDLPDQVHFPSLPDPYILQRPYDGAKYDVVTPIDFTDGTIAPLKSEHACNKWIGRLVRRTMPVTRTRRGVRTEVLEPVVGEVMSFNDRTHLFRVKYDDRLHEDIDWQELEPIIIHDKELGDGWELHNKTRAELELETRKKHPHDLFLGRKVRKYFTVKEGRGKNATARQYPFLGTVDHYDRKLGLFRIKYDDGCSECVTLSDLEDIIIILDDGKQHNRHHIGKTRQEVVSIITESVLWAEIVNEASDSVHDFTSVSTVGGDLARTFDTVSAVGGDIADTVHLEQKNTSRKVKVSFSDEVAFANADVDSTSDQARALRSEPIQALEDEKVQDTRNIVKDDHPKNFAEVLKHPESEDILESGRIEMQQMYDEGVFEYPTEAEIEELKRSGRIIMNLKMVYVRKYESKKLEDGRIIDVFKKWKGRLAAQGTREMLGIDAPWSSFSPTIGMTAIRTFMALASRSNLDVLHYDLSGAFLGTLLKRPVFAKLPKEAGEHAGRIVRCVKAIYGLKSSSRDFVKALGDKILEFEHEGVKIRRLSMDNCIYQFRNEKGEELLICHYVDDVLIGFNSASLKDKMLKLIREQWKVTEEGPLSRFIGLNFDRHADRLGWDVSMGPYIDKIVKRFKLTGSSPEESPMSDGFVILPEDLSEEPTEAMEAEFRSLIGSLSFAAITVRWDIAYAVSVLSRYLMKPNKKVIGEARRVVKYLMGTRDFKITWSTSPGKLKREEVNRLWACADASFAADVITRRSHGGYIVFLNGGPISWKSGLQKLVTLSTCESEFVTLCSAILELRYLRQLVADLGYEQEGPTVIWEDNKACIIVAEGDVSSAGRSKHIDVRFKAVAQSVKDGTVCVRYVPSKWNVADIMTKPLGKIQFKRLRDMVTSSEMEISSVSELLLEQEEEMLNLIIDYKEDMSYVLAPLSCRSYIYRHLSGECQRTRIQ